MTIRDSAGTICGIVLRHFLGQTRFILSHPNNAPPYEAADNGRYIHAVNVKQIEAQGKYLDAIKIVAKQPDRVA